MITSDKECRNEVDMLNGNIARVCVSANIDEINGMADYAVQRILKIKQYRIRKLKESRNE